MKRNKLYTVNKWNQPAFGVDRQSNNIFDGFTLGQSQQMNGLSLGTPLAAPAVYQHINWDDPVQRASVTGTTAGLVNGFRDSVLADNGNPFGLNGSTGTVSAPKGNGILGSAKGLLGNVAGGLGSMVGNAISDGYSTGGVGEGVATVGNLVGTALGPGIGTAVQFASGLVGGAINRGFGIKTDQAKLNAANEGTAKLRGFTSNASDFDSVRGVDAMAKVQNPYKNGWFTSRADAKNAELKRQRMEAQSWANRSVGNNIDNLVSTQMDNALANYAAFGGPLGADLHTGALGMMMQDNYLDAIDRSSEAVARGRGMAQPIGTLRAFGGELGTNGTDWTNGLLYIDEGGSHESNPLGGVPIGFDPEGVPNLVEEGETVFNDYVFSNRIKVPKDVKKSLGLGGSLKDSLTFADASKKLAKESEERPNDPISRESLNEMLGKLAEAQELERAKQASMDRGLLAALQDIQVNAFGGKLGNKFDTGSQMKNSGAFKSGVTDAWGQFTKPGLDAFIGQLEARLNMAPDENTKNAIRQEAVNQLNGIQQGYAGIYRPDNSGSYEFSKAVQDHQNRFNSAYGNTGFGSIADSIDLPKGANTADRATVWADGYWGPRTSIRNFGSTEYGDTAYYQGLVDRFKNLGLDFAPTLDYGTAGNKLYTLSIPEAAPAEESSKNYWPTDGSAAPVVRAGKGAEDETDEGNGRNNSKTYWTGLRYAPAFGAGIMSLTDALGLTNKPDYTMADRLEASAEQAGYAPNIEYDPIGDYLTYRPMDIWYQQNALNAQSRATDRNLMNTSGGNRGTAMAGLLANGYNSQLASGNLYRQALEYNDAKRERVADFNRKTNMFNSQMGLEAAMANARYSQQAKQMGLSGLAQAAALRDQIDARNGAARAANLTNLLNSLGDIGRENMAFNMINSTSAARNGYWIDKDGEVHYVSEKKSKGGNIRRNK